MYLTARGRLHLYWQKLCLADTTISCSENLRKLASKWTFSENADKSIAMAALHLQRPFFFLFFGKFWCFFQLVWETVKLFMCCINSVNVQIDLSFLETDHQLFDAFTFHLCDIYVASVLPKTKQIWPFCTEMLLPFICVAFMLNQRSKPIFPFCKYWLLIAAQNGNGWPG